MASGKWSIVAEPKARNIGGKNEGGIVISLVDSAGRKEEVTRVAFVRRNSRNPRNSLERQLQREITRARTAVDILNEQFSGTGELQ